MQSLQMTADFADEVDAAESDVTEQVRSVPSRLSASSRRWTARLLDSAVCGVCLLLLSPAIVAVWIAIRRSNYSGTMSCNSQVGTNPSAAAVKMPQPVIISLKPERMRHVAYDGSSIQSVPANAAHAAV